ncbi:hypothetical protein HU230_0029740 [Bradyrhizobium quebecense]|uniref:Uncharacterized protein n=1 Tax=Bradyrhizobium quebecense TaxID=2748629 RepID=A0A973WHG0_9BRAD|nr:hypothetical protein [Bradyrhizobium quebecense]UGA42449.1 hypothetical protein HU230_0029740 [Bradyrhizobium quebecense]
MRYADEITLARKAVLTVEGKTLKADLKGSGMSFNDFWEEADFTVIEDAYRRASRVISPDLSRTYAEHLADKKEADSVEEALIEAHADIAALGLVPDVKTYLDDEASKLAKSWLSKYRVQVKSLSDERQEAYRQIKEMSADPEDIDLAKPKSWMEATTIREQDGNETHLPTYDRHLLCGDNGEFPAEMNTWEIEVLKAEMARTGFQAWYRNPSRSSQDSLGIAYAVNSRVMIMRPDFIFFSNQFDGSIAADIVDPHGPQLADALPKLRGLAQYAEDHATVYRRVEAIAKIGEKLRALDLTREDVRRAVRATEDAKSLYDSEFAADY